MPDFSNLKEQLDLLEWPDIYFFKFIVNNSPEHLALATALFDETSDITLHSSKSGKFVSVSVKEMMMSAESVIAKYEKASKIEGIISL